MNKSCYVYIMADTGKNFLYVGMTNNLKRRVFEHKNKLTRGFAEKYNVNRLVYYEQTLNIKSAILKEKQFRAGSRLKKIESIDTMNPEWKDLYDSLS